MTIPENELKPCPKCGRKGIYVMSDGSGTVGRDSGAVSCPNQFCMPFTKIYTVDEWQELERHESTASREQHERVSAQLSHEVSDARILSLLQLIQDIITYPERTCDFVSTWLDEHRNKDGSYALDNPEVEAKAATLRAMVS